MFTCVILACGGETLGPDRRPYGPGAPNASARPADAIGEPTAAAHAKHALAGASRATRQAQARRDALR
ncbi:hypothetical protein WG70_14410 [Burkholderia oklahomensis EO147]|nr:hypothetical protein WG70_14410 [Burkholderia oklahomensis EO147]AOI47583.1 hypothetical protein WI23_01145 [Burkholderia oklahomensis C6786]KUY51151.1 hypothetical protein WG70_17130 [Burkholderia oklahomensis EO147]KUY54939.1 hypothetical protein WI23_21090 [Burkholderia oklahomensis C6786]